MKTYTMDHKWRGAVVLAVLAASSCNQMPEPYGPLPTAAQVAWQRSEMNLFAHFGPNTFSGLEWGEGTEPEDLFQPSDLNCRQWTKIAKEAGFGGVILTAKHHDGFCLWPNPENGHTVAQSSWRDGQGDVLRELSEACQADGIGFGIYISPWDRYDPTYGTPAYNEVFARTLQSALGNYGPVFEQWFDGANGEGPNGKRQVYDWPLFNSTVASLQPEAIIFSGVGPGCRWVGNERGEAGETDWSTLNTEGFTAGKHSPSRESLFCGDEGGAGWVPAECDVSIRPGWFWRESENGLVKDLQTLLKIYYETVGRNAVMLLNVPPDKTGRLHAVDSARLMEFRAALDEIFSEDLALGASVKAPSRRGRLSAPKHLTDGDIDTFWAAPDGNLTPTLTLNFRSPVTFNRIMLQEYIPLGQRVAGFTVEVLAENGTWEQVATGTTIGNKRLLLTKETTARAIRLIIDRSLAPPVLNGLSLFEDRVYRQM
ncbi:MAG: alpha-L-fucosidase [Bacteroidales bacterium]|nr:alpha-L-fucosidase [Bacteroidales bacterium]